MRRLTRLFLLALACVPLSFAQGTTSTATIHQLFQEDQRDQQVDFDALSDPAQRVVRARYSQRETKVKELMENAKALTTRDFFDAGVILTHSHSPENQLLAHLAFTAAAFGGMDEAKHLAATSLDRYLSFSKQTPVFGTIFQIPYQGWHHDVSPAMNDALRMAFCVPSRATLDRFFEQEKSGVAPQVINGHDEFWNDKSKACH